MQSDTVSVTEMCALTAYPSLIKSEIMSDEDDSPSHSSLEVVILLTPSLGCIFSTSYSSSSFLSEADVNMLLLSHHYRNTGIPPFDIFLCSGDDDFYE